MKKLLVVLICIFLLASCMTAPQPTRVYHVYIINYHDGTQTVSIDILAEVPQTTTQTKTVTTSTDADANLTPY